MSHVYGVVRPHICHSECDNAESLTFGLGRGWVFGWNCLVLKGLDCILKAGSECWLLPVLSINGGFSSLQRIRATVNSQEQKRLLMDLDISMRTVDCHFTVTFYGALFREVNFNLDNRRKWNKIVFVFLFFIMLCFKRFSRLPPDHICMFIL